MIQVILGNDQARAEEKAVANVHDGNVPDGESLFECIRFWCAASCFMAVF